MSAETEPLLSPEEYLAGEERSEIRHEYWQGRIYAMAGASIPHGVILGNLLALVHGRLRGTGCVTVTNDTKVRIEAADVYYYPDLLVLCDERDLQASNVARYPRIIVEVLSQSTEAFDRGWKFEHYQALESLQEYALVSQDRSRVEVFQREAAGVWNYRVYSSEDEMELVSIDFRTPVAALYENVRFPDTPRRTPIPGES